MQITKKQIKDRGYTDLVDVLMDLPGYDIISQYYMAIKGDTCRTRHQRDIS